MTKLVVRWILMRAFVVAAVVLCFLAVTNTGSDRGEISSAEAQRFGVRSLKREAGALPKISAEMKFRYEEHKSFRNFEGNGATLVSQRAVHTIARDLKQRIKLPFEMQVVFKECGGPDSFYDEDTHKITICNELIDGYYVLFSRTLKERAAREDATKGVTVAMFLHEVAHALIDGWKLPITGRDEDAADQFSTLLLINAIPDGDVMALDGARSFKLLADFEKGQEKDYSDLHSLDEQRYFNMICLVYGHRPQQYEYLVRNGSLPVRRAFDCEEEYARVNNAWQTLLAPHLLFPHVPSLEDNTAGWSRAF